MITIEKWLRLVSIHTPREGGDSFTQFIRFSNKSFNPHPPRGGRLDLVQLNAERLSVSIHTPREGGDATLFGSALSQVMFQSTPPARGATQMTPRVILTKKFQSTPPARGATYLRGGCNACAVVSIHTPREGGDGLMPDTYTSQFSGVSIHTPREGGDGVLHRLRKGPH